MEKAPIFQCMFIHQYLDFFNNYPTKPTTLFKIQWDKNFKYSHVDRVTCTTVLSVFLFGYNSKIYISL